MKDLKVKPVTVPYYSHYIKNIRTYMGAKLEITDLGDNLYALAIGKVRVYQLKGDTLELCYQLFKMTDITALQYNHGVLVAQERHMMKIVDFRYRPKSKVNIVIAKFTVETRAIDFEDKTWTCMDDPNIYRVEGNCGRLLKTSKNVRVHLMTDDPWMFEEQSSKKGTPFCLLAKLKKIEPEDIKTAVFVKEEKVEGIWTFVDITRKEVEELLIASTWKAAPEVSQ